MSSARAPWSRRVDAALFHGALLFLAVSLSTPQAFGQATPNSLSAQKIEEALRDLRARPIAIQEVGDPQYAGFRSRLQEGVRLRRGVLLSPYTRLAIYGSRILGTPDPEVVARLAAPELWIVVFPYSRDRARAVLGEETSWRLDPEESLRGHGVTGGRVFVPRDVRVSTREPTRRDVQAVWHETRGFDFGHWFSDEWVKGRSLVAAFPMNDPAIAGRTAQITVEGVTEEDGRDTFDTWSSSLSLIPDRDWKRSLGEK